MKKIIKKLLYSFKKYSLPKNVAYQFYFVFHTEAIYDDSIFELLLNFCTEYHEITGTKVINTIMPYTNPRIQKLAQEHNCSQQEYIHRIIQLEKSSTIGYHGHYYDQDNLTDELKREKRSKDFVIETFSAELNWFKTNIPNFQPIYSAGWWYMNEDILLAQAQNNVIFDFSFTYNPNFINNFSKAYLKQNRIKLGESFNIGSTEHIQTISGCHNTPFTEDFNRNLIALTKTILHNRTVTGALCTHDFNLKEDYDTTKDCIQQLATSKNVAFINLEGT